MRSNTRGGLVSNLIIATSIAILVAGAVLLIYFKETSKPKYAAPTCAKLGGYCGCWELEPDGFINWKTVDKRCPLDWERGCPPGFGNRTDTDCAYDSVIENDLCCFPPEVAP